MGRRKLNIGKWKVGSQANGPKGVVQCWQGDLLSSLNWSRLLYHCFESDVSYKNIWNAIIKMQTKTNSESHRCILCLSVTIVYGRQQKSEQKASYSLAMMMKNRINGYIRSIDSVSDRRPGSKDALCTSHHSPLTSHTFCRIFLI